MAYITLKKNISFNIDNDNLYLKTDIYDDLSKTIQINSRLIDYVLSRILKIRAQDSISHLKIYLSEHTFQFKGLGYTETFDSNGETFELNQDFNKFEWNIFEQALKLCKIRYTRKIKKGWYIYELFIISSSSLNDDSLINIKSSDNEFRNNLYKIYLEQLYTDFTFVSRDNQKIRLHKVILASHNISYFNRIFSSSFKENTNNEIVFPEYSIETLKRLNDYLYLDCGKWYHLHKRLPLEDIKSMLELSDYLDISQLFNVCCMIIRNFHWKHYSILEAFSESQHENRVLKHILFYKPCTPKQYFLEETYQDLQDFILPGLRDKLEYIKTYHMRAFSLVDISEELRHYYRFVYTIGSMVKESYNVYLLFKYDSSKDKRVMEFCSYDKNGKRCNPDDLEVYLNNNVINDLIVDHISDIQMRCIETEKGYNMNLLGEVLR